MSTGPHENAIPMRVQQRRYALQQGQKTQQDNGVNPTQHDSMLAHGVFNMCALAYVVLAGTGQDPRCWLTFDPGPARSVRKSLNPSSRISPGQRYYLSTVGTDTRGLAGEPEFVEAPAPSDVDVWEVFQRIIKRVMKQLVRRGILVEDQGEMCLADPDDDSEEARTLRPLHRGSCVYRIAFGTRAGQKVLTLQGALPRDASGKQKLCANSQGLCANSQGFSLHAAVRRGAGQRKTLERLCRYITRPALADDRVQVKASGQAVSRTCGDSGQSCEAK
jgi:hypothetical protein